MTVLLDRAIEELIERYNSQLGDKDESDTTASDDIADRV
jgi:hypothetical protein